MIDQSKITEVLDPCLREMQMVKRNIFHDAWNGLTAHAVDACVLADCIDKIAAIAYPELAVNGKAPVPRRIDEEEVALAAMYNRQ